MFLKTIKAYADNFQTAQVYIAWDKKLNPELSNFRKELTGGTYKGTRDPSKNEEIYKDVDDIVAATGLLGVKNIFPGRLEADDVISWLCNALPGEKVIISADKDFIQLVDANVSCYNPSKKEKICAANVESIMGMTTKEFVYYKAIAGDVSDNIPGLAGYGPVKGTKLAKAIVAGTPIEEKHKAIIERNLLLVDLSHGLTLHEDEIQLYQEQLDALKSKVPQFDEFLQLCEQKEFESIIRSFDYWKTTFSKQETGDLLAGYFKLFE